jgi:hypothetical protein
MVRTQLLLLMLISYVFADGILFRRQDNPGISCMLTINQNGKLAAWQCPANADPVYFKYHSAGKLENGDNVFLFASPYVTMAFTERYDQLSLMPIQVGSLPSVLFIRADLLAPPPITPPPAQMWGDFCDPLDRDIVTGRCPYSSGGGGATGGMDVSSCLKSADDAMATANRMGDGVAATALRQRAIAARSDCLNR